jgi:hypothetical protein
VGVLAVVGAVLVGGDRTGDLPAAVSLRGLMVVLASAAFMFALLIPWRRAGTRQDELVARRPAVAITVGALVTAELKQDLHRLFGVVPRTWPTRVTLAGTAEALEVWTNQSATPRLSIPWADIRSLDHGQASSAGRSFAAVKVELRGGGTFSVALAPSGFLGAGGPPSGEKDRLIARLRELKDHATV